MSKDLKTIANNSDAKRKKKSKIIKIKLDEIGKKKPKRWNHWNVWFAFTANSQERPGVKYSVIIQTIEDIGITELNWKDLSTGKVPMMVNCSCPDFKYRQEVALNKAGNAMIRDSNGAKPVITNPEMIPYICKHSLACYERVKQIVRSKKLDSITDIRTKNYYDNK